MVGETTIKLAVLIDADNAQSSIVGLLLAEISKYGTAFVRRAYGDWTGTSLKGWKDQFLKQSIQPIQQFAYTYGKNATDAAMIIDAMDLLYSNRFDGFCLVSSDSDFTRLAARIRESGLIVYGFGERKTPKPFVAACDKFVYFENLISDEELAPQTDDVVITATLQEQTLATQVTSDTRVVRRLRAALKAAEDEDGWATLANVGQLVTKQHPDFDPRTYGYAKLSELIAATCKFNITRRNPGKGKPDVIYIRDKLWVRATHIGQPPSLASP